VPNGLLKKSAIAQCGSELADFARYDVRGLRQMAIQFASRLAAQFKWSPRPNGREVTIDGTCVGLGSARVRRVSRHMICLPGGTFTQC
jgi:hypothetical protein